MATRHRQLGRARSLLLCLLVILAIAPGALAPASAAPASLPAVQLPETETGSALAWALDEVNGGAASLTPADLRDHFAPDFLAALPPPQLLSVFQGYLAPNGPMRAARFEGPTSGLRLQVILTTPGSDWRVSIGVQPGSGWLIDELYFEPVAPPQLPAKAPKSWTSLDQRLAKIAPDVSFVAAEVTDGACAPIHAYHEETTLGIGSNFKLYVLGELARQVGEGSRTWDDLLPVEDTLRSLPSGTMLYEPAGSLFPLRYYAEQMISISDNTATDHLMVALGREQVEQILAPMGHHEPTLNQPLLMTREWFAIKLRFSAKQLKRYLAADADGKREILVEQAGPAADTLTEVDEWTGSYLIDSVEWFASAADLCRALAYLHVESQQPGLGEIQDALSINPGIPFDAETWRYVGYKGGYETGVKSDAWLLQRADGRWFTVTAIINDPNKEIDGWGLWALMTPTVNLLAKAP